MKRQATHCEKRLENYIYDKELVSWMYKELLKLNQKERRAKE